MKIFYTCIGSVFKVFYDLDKSLAELNNIKSSFYLTDKIYSKNYLKKNNIILKNSINEWELIEECKKSKIRINKKIKNIINEEFLWKAAVADRRLYNGIYAKYTQNHNTSLDHKFIHKLICHSYAKIYNHLNKFKPDIIVSHSTATFGILITYMIAKRLNIKFVNLRYTKIDNYITFARDNEEKYVDIKMNFQKKIFNRKSINISKKFISKYRSKKNFKYSGSPFLSSVQNHSS